MAEFRQSFYSVINSNNLNNYSLFVTTEPICTFYILFKFALLFLILKL